MYIGKQILILIFFFDSTYLKYPRQEAGGGKHSRSRFLEKKKI